MAGRRSTPGDSKNGSGSTGKRVADSTGGGGTTDGEEGREDQGVQQGSEETDAADTGEQPGTSGITPITADAPGVPEGDTNPTEKEIYYLIHEDLDSGNYFKVVERAMISSIARDIEKLSDAVASCAILIKGVRMDFRIDQTRTFKCVEGEVIL